MLLVLLVDIKHMGQIWVFVLDKLLICADSVNLALIHNHYAICQVQEVHCMSNKDPRLIFKDTVEDFLKDHLSDMCIEC